MTHPAVRVAAADALGQVGGGMLPPGLARASRDEVTTVRVAATRALAYYNDPQAVELAVNALLDPDRDTAVSAGESLVRLAPPPLDESVRRAGTRLQRERLAGRNGPSSWTRSER